MTFAYDGRVMKHRAISGVENYAVGLYEAMRQIAAPVLLEPVSPNRYVQQLWEHTCLPYTASRFKLLFCPANVAPLYLRKKSAMVFTLHDVAFRTFPDSVSAAFRRYYAFTVPRNIRRADRIVTISNASKDEIVRFYPEAAEKLIVIPPGIHERFRVLNSVPKRKQILFIGAINERKNLAGAIEAFLKLPDSLGYSLVVVGTLFGNLSVSEKTKAVVQKAKAHPRIIFKSGLSGEELVTEYNASACLLFPSFYEGFGLPPLEAMACGTPAVVSDRSSMPEACGDAAVYADPDDPDDIAAGITMLLENDDLRRKMTAKGLEHAATFSWRRSAQRHLDCFEKVLQE